MYDPMADLSKDNCGKTVTCPQCNGEGYILVQHEIPVHGCNGDERLCQKICPIPGWEEDYEVCPMCNGEKEVTR